MWKMLPTTLGSSLESMPWNSSMVRVGPSLAEAAWNWVTIVLIASSRSVY